jgi:flagellar M-ring protein FliF
VEALVSAAIGLDAARGDTIQVTAVAFPAPLDDPDAADPLEAAGATPITQYVGAAAVLLVAVALLFMTRTGAKGSRRGRKGSAEEAAHALPAGSTIGALPASAVNAGGSTAPAAGLPAGDPALLEETVRSLASDQPADVAALLSGWLKEGAST